MSKIELLYLTNSINALGSNFSCVNNELNYLYNNGLYYGDNLDNALARCSHLNFSKIW